MFEMIPQRIRSLFNRYSSWFVLLTITLLVYVTYRDLFSTFYQQDEWNTLGYIKAEGIGAFFKGQSILEILGGGGRPLSFPIHYLFYTYFPFQIAPFVLFALVFHVLNTFLVYKVTLALTKNRFIGSVAAIYFAIASTSHQAVSWVAATTTTLPSVFFSLLSILVYLQFLESRKRFSFYGSIFLATVAYFFKESSIFIFLLFPVLYLLYAKKPISFKELIKIHWPIVLYGLIAIVSRLGGLFFINQGLTTGFVTRNAYPIHKLLLHIVLYPIISFSQFYIYPGLVWPLATFLNILNYPRIAEEPFAIVVVETIGAEVITLMFSLFLLVGIFVVYKRNNPYKKELLFALVFCLTSFLPYVILDKSTAYLESRYFYPGEVGAAIIFALFVWFGKTYITSRFKRAASYLLILLAIVVVSYFNFQKKIIKADIKQQITIAQERKIIIDGVKKMSPKIHDKTVFFVSGSQDYFVPNHKLPFSQGMGFTLMTLYYDSGVVPGRFLSTNFLWHTTAQGYEEEGNKGFGYYSEIEKMVEDIKLKKFSPESVIGYYYKAETKELMSITSSLREEIEASLSSTITR